MTYVENPFVIVYFYLFFPHNVKTGRVNSLKRSTSRLYFGK